MYGYDQWRCYAPVTHNKAIIQHLSFYQSFDGPAPIPSMATMPLDDIRIINWSETYMSWNAQTKIFGMHVGGVNTLQDQHHLDKCIP